MKKAKKILSLILCLALAACLLTACGSKPADSSTEPEADQSDAFVLDMPAFVAKLEETEAVAMALELSPSIEGSDDFMADLYGMNLDIIEDYYGKVSGANVSCDAVLVVKAAPGEVENVKAALETARSSIAANFEMYLADQFEKAENGRVLTRGDYAILVILGDNDRITNGEVEDVYAEIDTAIAAALNG